MTQSLKSSRELFLKLGDIGSYTRLLTKLIDLITPPLCLICHQEIIKPNSLCPQCWGKLDQIAEPLCRLSAVPFPYDQGDNITSATALADPPPWQGARAAVIFDHISRNLIHALKYGDHHEAGRLMARLMIRAGTELLNEADILVPVPLHRRRLWQRRFNQSAYLAQLIGAAAKRPIALQLLSRIKPTNSQTGLKAKERRANMAQAFSIPQGCLAGKKIILIDDVMTTGATARACANILLHKAQASQVTLLVFALVLKT